MAKREMARKELKLEPGSFALLLIGNDWRNKGVPVLVAALDQLPDLRVHLLIVSREDSATAKARVEDRLQARIHFLPPRTDVEFYYSAADAYVGPSLEDTFALPPAEAMACALPVIVSAQNGTCEIITDRVDGLILNDPRDAVGLAQMIRRLVVDPEFRQRLGESATRTAQQYTWERNTRELEAVFFEALQNKARVAQETAAERL
jgi:UDP-glucose:(heptosyl)LPS alpha-1,3-glucosyltransferase